MDKIPFVLGGLVFLIVLMIAYNVFDSKFYMIHAPRSVSIKHPPKYETGVIIGSSRMQVLKIRLNAHGQYEYKIRYYNAFFGAYWISEEKF